MCLQNNSKREIPTELKARIGQPYKDKFMKGTILDVFWGLNIFSPLTRKTFLGVEFEIVTVDGEVIRTRSVNSNIEVLD